MNPTGFEDELRQRLQDLAAHAPHEPKRLARADGRSGDIDPNPARQHNRSTSKVLAGCAAALVVVAGLVALVVTRGDEGPQVVTDTTLLPTVPTTSPAPSTTTSFPQQPAPTGAVSTIPGGPGYGSTFPAMVWTGKELIIWGGEVVSEDQWSNRGGAYDPTTRTWREISPSPLPPMSEHTAVWTGEEMIICCGRIPEENGVSAAAYRPATDTWRTLASPPFDRAPFAQSVWTGTEMVVTGGSHYRGATAYNPSSDTWRTLADPPGIIERVADSAWTGEQMVVWNSHPPTAGFIYDLRSDTWDQLPEIPEELGLDGGTGAVVGDELIVWGAKQGPDNLGHPTGATLDLRERAWRALPDAPIEPGRIGNGSLTSPSSTSTGSEMIVFGGNLGGGGTNELTAPALAYNPTTGSWRMLGSGPTFYSAPLVWANGTAFLLGFELLAITP